MEKNILVDFHAHILPGMDHGCDDVMMSIAQMKMAKEHNIDIVIASSHFYPHMESVQSFLRRREEAWESLKVINWQEYPIIKLGAEVLVCNNIDKMPGIEELCIENSNILLIEMPFMRQWETNLIETVVRLRDEKGFEVIIVHGERYPAKEIKRLLVKGFQMQLNVSSIAKLFPSKCVKEYIKQDYVTALGTDIHGLRNYYKDFSKSIKKLGKRAERIMKKSYMLLE